MPATARPAMAAYHAMRSSKTAYFTLLNEMDVNSQTGRSPTLAETQRLEELLAKHNTAVQNFSTAMAAVTDTTAREQLILAISAASAEPGD